MRYCKMVMGYVGAVTNHIYCMMTEIQKEFWDLIG